MPRTSRWLEAGVIDLRGTLIDPGLHWHLPHGDEGYYYVSQLYDVEGEILGRNVRGFYGADDMYMNGQIYENDLLIGKQLHVTWYTWATRYTEGTLDAGHFMLGHDGLGMLLLCDENGEVRRTTDVDGHVELDSSGTWPVRIEVHAPGESWEFLPDPKGRMVDFMPMPNPQAEGRWRRVGDTRSSPRIGSPTARSRRHTAWCRAGEWRSPDMADLTAFEARRDELERWIAGAMPEAHLLPCHRSCQCHRAFRMSPCSPNSGGREPTELIPPSWCCGSSRPTEACSPTTTFDCSTT